MKHLPNFSPITTIPSIAVLILIPLFLSGKIIDYPRGTPQGGLIGALGVFIILISTFAITYIIFRIKKHFNNN